VAKHWVGVGYDNTMFDVEIALVMRSMFYYTVLTVRVVMLGTIHVLSIRLLAFCLWL
jgi:hypothetical protein